MSNEQGTRVIGPGSRCLVTGGLGFIGSNITRRLSELGAEVDVVDNLHPGSGGNTANLRGLGDNVRVHLGDMGDLEIVRPLLERAHYVFNLAGQTGHSDSMENPMVDLSLNVESQLNFLGACNSVNASARVIFASTRQIYGRPESIPVSEGHALSPVDINGVHKIAGEMYHRVFGMVYGLRPTILRLTNTFGPRMRVSDARQTFVGVWLRNVIQGVPFQIFGDGKQVRDFTFVDDVVDAFISCAESEDAVGKTYNLGGIEPLSLMSLAEKLVKKIDGSKFELTPFPKERQDIDIGNYFADDSLIRKDVGWEPRIGVDEGLDLSLDFYEKNREDYGIS